MDYALLFREIFVELGDKLVLVCMYCQRTFGTKPAEGVRAMISHDVCPECSKGIEDHGSFVIEP